MKMKLLALITILMLSMPTMAETLGKKELEDCVARNQGARKPKPKVVEYEPESNGSCRGSDKKNDKGKCVGSVQ